MYSFKAWLFLTWILLGIFQSPFILRGLSEEFDLQKWLDLQYFRIYCTLKTEHLAILMTKQLFQDVTTLTPT